MSDIVSSLDRERFSDFKNLLDSFHKPMPVVLCLQNIVTALFPNIFLGMDHRQPMASMVTVLSLKVRISRSSGMAAISLPSSVVANSPKHRPYWQAKAETMWMAALSL